MTAEIRVSDPRFPQRYYFTRPGKYALFLKEKGWNFSRGNPDYYWTNNVDLATVTFFELHLDLPDWNNKHSYTVEA